MQKYTNFVFIRKKLLVLLNKKNINHYITSTYNPKQKLESKLIIQNRTRRFPDYKHHLNNTSFVLSRLSKYNLSLQKICIERKYQEKLYY